MFVCKNVCGCVCVYVREFAHLSLRVCVGSACVCVFGTYMHVSEYMSVCIVCENVCVRVCMHAWVFVRVYMCKWVNMNRYLSPNISVSLFIGV